MGRRHMRRGLGQPGGLMLTAVVGAQSNDLLGRADFV